MDIMNNKKKKNFLKYLIFPFIVISVFLLLLRPIGDTLIINDPLQKSDLITAISGPEYRIIYAAELYKKGLGATLFFTGGFSQENQRSEATWSKYVATITGVPEEAIAIDDTTVISTYDEVVLLKKYMEAHPGTIQSIIIVTDAYHTRRARWIYQKVLGDEITILMAPVPFERTGLSKSWWSNAESRKFVFNEYLKFVFYILRYQMTNRSLQQWLAQFDKF
jgi:uncharacterized SAM-binding protein YcdF (DUF218 family)